MIGGGLFEPNLDQVDDAYRSSERSFGLTFAAIGLAIGFAKLWYGQRIGWVWVSGAGAILILALLCSWIFGPFRSTLGTIGAPAAALRHAGGHASGVRGHRCPDRPHSAVPGERSVATETRSYSDDLLD